MASGGTISWRLCLLGAIVEALALGACGSSKSESPAKMPVEGPGAPKGAASPRTAIIEFFDAKRTGDTERGCSLESKDFQIAQYKQAGQACLDNLANKQPQPVWANPVKIDKLDEAPDSAAARIRPNAGSDAPAEITLVRGEGGWLVNSLR